MARPPHPRIDLPHHGGDSLLFCAVFVALALGTPFFAPSYVSAWGVAALVAIWIAAAWLCCPRRPFVEIDTAGRTAHIGVTTLIFRRRRRSIAIRGTITVRTDLLPRETTPCFALHLGEAADWPDTLVAVAEPSSATATEGPASDVADLERIALWLSRMTTLVAQRDGYVVTGDRWRAIKGHLGPLSDTTPPPAGPPLHPSPPS